MAKKRPSLPQLKKYDVTQKVISELVNVESRAIIFATVNTARTAADLSARLRIPLSTVYKKVSDLLELALISEGTEFLDGVGKVKVYRSRIKSAEIYIKRLEPKVALVSNKR